MLNKELVAEFADCLPGSKICVVNPGIDGSDYERYTIIKITFLVSKAPEDTIIEAGSGGSFMRVEEFVTILKEQDADGTVQVYIEGWEGQQFAYFDIARVRQGPYLHSIILGDWRCGG
jgi:hypothetical protein